MGCTSKSLRRRRQKKVEKAAAMGNVIETADISPVTVWPPVTEPVRSWSQLYPNSSGEKSKTMWSRPTITHKNPLTNTMCLSDSANDWSKAVYMLREDVTEQ